MERSASGEADSSLAGQQIDHLNNIQLTVQTVELITNEHLPLLLPVCPLPATASTYRATSAQLAARTHSATPCTVPLAIPTQYADSGLSVPKSVDLLS